MATIKFSCKSCGSSISAPKGASVVKCKYCSEGNPVPTQNPDGIAAASKQIILALYGSSALFLIIPAVIYFVNYSDNNSKDSSIIDSVTDFVNPSNNSNTNQAGSNNESPSIGQASTKGDQFYWYGGQRPPTIYSDDSGSFIVGITRNKNADNVIFAAVDLKTQKHRWEVGPFQKSNELEFLISENKMVIVIPKIVSGKQDMSASVVKVLDLFTAKELATKEITDKPDGICRLNDSIRVREIVTKKGAGPMVNIKMEPIPADDPLRKGAEHKIRINVKDGKNITVDLATLKFESYTNKQNGLSGMWNKCNWYSGINSTDTDYNNLYESKPPKIEGYQLDSYCNVDDFHGGVYLKHPGTPVPQMVGFSHKKNKINWKKPMASTPSTAIKGTGDGINQSYQVACHGTTIIAPYKTGSGPTRITAFDLKTGKNLWETPPDAPWDNDLENLSISEKYVVLLFHPCSRILDAKTGKIIGSYGIQCN